MKLFRAVRKMREWRNHSILGTIFTTSELMDWYYTFIWIWAW
jgi:hypothetical protein